MLMIQFKCNKIMVTNSAQSDPINEIKQFLILQTKQIEVRLELQQQVQTEQQTSIISQENTNRLITIKYTNISKLNEMNFTHSPPLFVKQITPRKFIYLTKYRIIYQSNGKLPCISSAVLVQSDPLMLEYSQKREEAIVVTSNSIEIYLCDFLNDIQLKKCIILNDQVVYSIKEGVDSKWQLYGEIYQYSNSYMTINSVQKIALQQQKQTNIMGECFIHEFQLYITRDCLLHVYDHSKETSSCIRMGDHNNVNCQIRKYLKSVNDSNNDNNNKKIKMKGWRLQMNNRQLKQKNDTTLQQSQNIYRSQRFRSGVMKQPILSRAQSLNTEKNNTPSYNRFLSELDHQLNLNDKAENNQNSKQAEFVLILEIDQRFMIALVPPVGEYSPINRQLTKSNLQSRDESVNRELTKRTNSIITIDRQRPIKDKMQQSLSSFKSLRKWQIINLSNLNTLNTISNQLIHLKNEFDILFSSPCCHFQTSSISTLDDEFGVGNPTPIEKKQWMGVCVLYKVDSRDNIKNGQIKMSNDAKQQPFNNLVFLLQIIRLNKVEDVVALNDTDKRQQGDTDKEKQNTRNKFILHNKVLQSQLYQLDIKDQPQNPHLTPSKQFLQLLISSSFSQIKTQSQNIPSNKLTLQLLKLQFTNKNSIELQFMFYDQLNKNSKQFQYTIVTASKLSFCEEQLSPQKGKTPQTIVKSNKQHNQLPEQTKPVDKKYSNSANTFSLNNVSLTTSQSMAESRPFQAHLIPLDSLELQNNDILISIPSNASSKNNQSKNMQMAKNHQEQPVVNIRYEHTLNVHDNAKNISQGYKKENKPSVQNCPLSFSPYSPYTSSSQYISHLQTATLLIPNHLTIHQLSQQQYGQETSRFEHEQIQEIVQIHDINSPFDTDHLITSNVKRVQNQHIDHQRQEKEFYEKFLGHFEHNKQSRQRDTENERNKNIHYYENDYKDDSRESFNKDFKVSKASNDEYKRETITKMIGGKDISEIVNVRNLSLHTDEEEPDVEISKSRATVELGEEIQKRYNLKDAVEDNDHNPAEHAGYGLFSKQNHQEQVSFQQPTVILIDKMDQSQQKVYQPLQKHNTTNEYYIDTASNPNTPAFNNDFHHNFDHDFTNKHSDRGSANDDHWNNFTKKWNVKQSRQLNQDDQFVEMCEVMGSINLKGSHIRNQPKSQYVDQSEFHQLSPKVQAFCVSPQHLTWQEVREIQSKKYTQLMRQVFIKSQQKFNTLIRQFLAEIIRQQEARLFFAQYIRTFSGRTRDILVRLYMSLPDSEQNKHYMSKALSEFKLSQVPEICLPISRDILQIFKFLYPSVYIEDLLKPSMHLFERLLENYFLLQKLPIDQLHIEDEVIDLSHPRNMLNVMLYLNEHYNLPMTQLFQVYCSTLIKNNCSQIVIKMVKQQQTFEICEVNKNILEDIVQTVIVQKLKQSSSNIQWLGKTLDILQCNLSSESVKKKQRLTKLLNIIDRLNLSDCKFSIDALFHLSELKNLYVFCNALIRQNSTDSLKKLPFRKIYKQLYWITNDKKITFYNQELKDLMQLLCEKYFQNGDLFKGFEKLAMFVIIEKRGFMAKMLFKYMEGRMINRLANKAFNSKQQFMLTFKQFFSSSLSRSHSRSRTFSITSRDSQFRHISHDKLDFASAHSYLINLSFQKFSLLYRSCIYSTQSEQIMYVCYVDYQLAAELATYHLITKKEWQDLNDKLQNFIPKDEIRKLHSKHNINFNAQVLINDSDQEEINQMSFNSFMLKDPIYLNNSIKQKNQPHIIKSLQSLQMDQTPKNHANGKKNNVYRSKSDSKMAEEYFSDLQSIPLLGSLKYEVNPETILKILKQLYQHEGSISKMKTFLKGLSMIDRERVKIYHYQKFKILANLQLDFKIDQLVPFQVLTCPDHNICLDLIKSNGLKKDLEMHNFWVIFMIIEILLSKGQDVAIIMIEKLIQMKNVKDLDRFVDKIITICKISKKRLKQLSQNLQNSGKKSLSIQINKKIDPQTF